MLLKSLTLENFRQFRKKQEVTFTTDANKNVTVIMGENGSGKTAFAQAFTWCLYGATDFTDKLMLNKVVANNMLPENKATVRVDLSLTHNLTEYTITREQTHRKDLRGKIQAQNTVLNVSYKKNGQQEFLQPLETGLRVEEILPRELSKYFFFDGERIGSMSKDIRKGKSKEFARAVRGLLGLNALISTLEHLNPRSKYGVIGSYNNSYDSSSDKRIAMYTKDILLAQERLNAIDIRLEEIITEEQLAQEKCEELSLKIRKNADSELLQKRKEQLQGEIRKIKKAKNSSLSSMTQRFNTNASSYFAKSMIRDALEKLSGADKLDKSIHGVNARTIKQLIERKECLCGTKIEVGKDVYIKLTELFKFIPPKSIGTMIEEFVKESEIRTKTSSELYNDVSERYKIIREYEGDVNKKTGEVKTIEKNLLGMANVSALQSELTRYKKTIEQGQTERDELNKEKGSVETKRDRLITERSELALRDEKNRKIEIYKAYAQYMHNKLTITYKENEDAVRGKLQNNINVIFKNIYEGGLSLTIDEKYNIQVSVDDFDSYNTDVETSTAQSISIIFAFISGIIKMARESSDSENKMLESEPYPLVMDAPLSAFDKRRIKSVCDALPAVAEQVIIFIKDTDGEIAEKNMGDKVGQRYMFDKKNEFETYLMAR